jgi:hypothetical protein
VSGELEAVITTVHVPACEYIAQMTADSDIVRVTTEVVNANTAPGSVVSVSLQDGLGWSGDPILKVTIVINDENVLHDEIPLNILTQLRDGLESIGESRFPIIDYATPKELAAEHYNASVDDDYPAGPTF